MSSPYPPAPEPEGQSGPQGPSGAGYPAPQGQRGSGQPPQGQPPQGQPPQGYPGAGYPPPAPGYAAPGPMPGYPGAMPGMPPTAGAPQPAGPRPGSVTTAVRLMWVGAALAVVSALLTPTMGDSLRGQIRDAMATSNAGLTPSELDGIVTAVLAVALVFGLIGAGLWLLMAWLNGKGKNWARIVATVFFAIGLISTLSGLTRAGDAPLLTILSLASAIVGGVAVFFLWRKESSAWFQAQSAPRY